MSLKILEHAFFCGHGRGLASSSILQGAVWEAALRTTNGLLTGLRVDATDFDTTDAYTRATTVLRRLVQVDYHAATTHSGHPDRPQSVRAFATKWRGLVLTKRRTIDCLF